jgi:hypothetical protein
MTRRRIRVPDIAGPVVQLCWRQAPTMERCDRRQGHGGLHLWELQPRVPPPIEAPGADPIDVNRTAAALGETRLDLAPTPGER